MKLKLLGGNSEIVSFFVYRQLILISMFPWVKSWTSKYLYWILLFLFVYPYIRASITSSTNISPCNITKHYARVTSMLLLSSSIKSREDINHQSHEHLPFWMIRLYHLTFLWCIELTLRDFLIWSNITKGSWCARWSHISFVIEQ